MILWALVACAPADLEQQLALDADYATFVRDVQPLLQGRCSGGSCHGSASRPLEVYGPGHRMDGATGDLTEDELWANYVRASLFLEEIDAPQKSWLLRKPLAPESGGMPHVGGVFFEDTDAAGYAAILGWIRTSHRWETP